MKTSCRGNIGGFTLIELLVVVLIIGILSAIALPQYQKSVTKAKAAEVWTVAKTIIEAEKVYYMQNGSVTSDLEELSVEIPTELKNWTLVMGQGSPRFEGKNQLEGITIHVEVSIPGYPDLVDGIRCYGSDLCENVLPCSGGCLRRDTSSGSVYDCTCPL